MKNTLFAVALFLSPVLAQASVLSQNDVSILMPLPTNSSADSLLRPDSAGAFGELLPRDLYDKMPNLSFQSPDQVFALLRVVAIRLDPCFPVAPPLTGCQAQIRMVWQPVAQTPAGQVLTMDAAVHTFYNLSNTDFSEMIAKFETLKATTGSSVQDEVLTINPLLKKLGYDSSYGKEFFKIILSQVGASRLSQATFMQLRGSGNIWNFGGFVVSAGETSDLGIPRINDVNQAFFNKTLTSSYFQGGANPAPAGADTFNLLMIDSRKITPSDEAEVIENTMATFRIENPKNHNPHTVDCVSCHVAQSARIWATRQYPWLMLEGRGSQFKFASKFNLSNNSVSPGNTKLLRSFGYNGAEPAISQRVVNETAAVLEALYP